MAKWIIRRARDGEYVRTIEAPNLSVAMNRAYASLNPLEKLTVRSAVSEQLAADEELIFKRNEIQRKEQLSTLEKRQAWNQAIEEYRQRQKEVRP